MVVVIYRNIKGMIETFDLNWWKSFANQLGLKVDNQMTVNTTTINVYRNEKSASFTIYRLGSTHEICLDYLRLDPEDKQLVNLIDYVIRSMFLSGEKHIIIPGSITESTYYKAGQMVNSNNRDFPFQFELCLLKETIFGHVHLLLDELIDAQRLDDIERILKIKESLYLYQKQLIDLNKQFLP